MSRKILAAGVAASLLAACSLAPAYKPPKTEEVPAFKEAGDWMPAQPADAQQRDSVVLLVGISAKGRVDAVRVVHSDEHAFEASAVDTVKKWKFRPAEKDGHAVPVQVTVEMKFEK